MYGSFVGSSFQEFSCSSLYLILSNHDARDRVVAKESLSHVVGTLLMKISDISFSICSVIVSSPLLARSTSASERMISLMRRQITSHS